ncbi:MAG: GMC family oxidoreductase [Nitrospirota bacterium]
MANLQPKKEHVDVVIIGCGAGGGVTAKELGEAGLSVVVLEVGKRYNPTTDYRTDQRDFAVKWNIFQPDDPRRDHYTSGGGQDFYYWRVKGVGGSTLAFWAVTPRFHESDFRTRTEDGVGDDWPLTYEDLEPYYTKVEYELGVSGPSGAEGNPFDPPRSKPFPTPAHKISCPTRVLQRGAAKLGLHLVQSPLAIPTQNWGGRAACMRAGVCGLGCKVKAKSSIDVTYIPKAEATGRVEVRTYCQAREITVGDDRKVRSVVYFDAAGREHEITARAFVVAGNAVETPRLLLMSTSARFPDGLANSNGLVGKYFMDHLNLGMSAVFSEWLEPWKGPMAGGMLQDFYATNKRNSFARGWMTEVNNGYQWPQAVAVGESGWGVEHKRQMKRLVGHRLGLVTVGEQLPDIRNRVMLDPEQKDHLGLPVPRIINEPRDNDQAMLKAIKPHLQEVLSASGATEIALTEYGPGRSLHYMGSCRMGKDPRSSVVDPFCRTHDVPNLFIGDGSVFVTGAAVNPTLTIAALATRTSEHIAVAFKRGEL